MSDRKSLQVILMHEDRPARILAERPLTEGGCAVVALRDGDAPIEFLTGRGVNVVRLDLNLSEGEEGGGVRMLRGSTDDTDVLVVGSGADAFGPTFDEGHSYLTRPLDPSLLKQLSTVDPAAAAVPGAEAPRGADGDRKKPVIARSDVMRRVWLTVERVAASDASVLIRGETGVGKSLVARNLHDASPRRNKPFVVINCSAFQDQLLESELFGHERGSFTGASSRKQGLFEVADGGTLFLDEVAEMSSAMQAKLLHVLDTGEMRRVGSTKPTRVNVRVVAATNKDIEEEVEEGRFRQDLLFRLRVVSVLVPPLRERKEEIPQLVEVFLNRFSVRGLPPKRLSQRALERLMEYQWQGNVRELANTIEGLVLLAPGQLIGVEDLPPGFRTTYFVDAVQEHAEEPVSMRDMEKAHILRALQFTEGKKAPAARLLGIDIKTLNNKIKAYEVGS